MERLKNKTALIVDNAETDRILLRNLLQGEMNLVEADSVDRAIRRIQDGPSMPDIILLNTVFPEKSGFEFLEFLRDNRYLEEIPVIVISSDNNDSLVERAFKLGAFDYIRSPFSSRLVAWRVLTATLVYQAKRELAHKVEHLYATRRQDRTDIADFPELHTEKEFFEKSERLLGKEAVGPMCMVAVALDHFKLFTKLYGRESGDKYLKDVATSLQGYAHRFGGIVGYAGLDSFYYLCPDRPDLVPAMEISTRETLKARNLEIGFAPKFGIYRIADPGKPVVDICDCALTALANVMDDYTRLVAWYDTAIEQKSDEFKLLREVEYGLRKSEFTFVLQPKCNMVTKKIVGAEALVRWYRPDNTMVSPAVFVPVLEENGIISKVDSLVWRDVCKFQRQCLDTGRPLLPISINVSRVDIYTMDVPGFLSDLLRKYDLPMQCIELEITESAYVDGDHNLGLEIAKIKEKGFTILMDDFGSGYSSLNSLKELDVDILKIDMRFLNFNAATMDKGVSILKSIIDMAHALHMPIIMEGVETEEQVRFLCDLGCRYAQGYYFYRPLTKEKYEQMLTVPRNLDMEGIQPPAKVVE